jgi:hypothetical protein
MKIGIQPDATRVEFLNLLSTDASNAEKSIAYASYLIVGPMKALLIMCILVNQVNYVMLSGLMLFFLLMPVHILLTRMFSLSKCVNAII